MTARRIFFVLGVVCALALPARATWVVGGSHDVTDAPYGGRFNQIQFVPPSCPQQVGTNIIWPITAFAKITNGAFAVYLVGGFYDCGIVGDVPPTGKGKTQRIWVVPNDTNVWQFSDCAKLAGSVVTFVWTNPPQSAGGSNVIPANVLTNGQRGANLITPNLYSPVLYSAIDGATGLPLGGGSSTGGLTAPQIGALVATSNYLTASKAATTYLPLHGPADSSLLANALAAGAGIYYPNQHLAIGFSANSGQLIDQSGQALTTWGNGHLLGPDGTDLVTQSGLVSSLLVGNRIGLDGYGSISFPGLNVINFGFGQGGGNGGGYVNLTGFGGDGSQLLNIQASQVRGVLSNNTTGSSAWVGAGVTNQWQADAVSLTTPLFRPIGAQIHWSDIAQDGALDGQLRKWSAASGTWVSADDLTGGSGGGVLTFNTRQGAVTLVTADITGAGGLLYSSSLNASNLSGTIADGRLSGNVALKSDVVSSTNLLNAALRSAITNATNGMVAAAASVPFTGITGWPIYLNQWAGLPTNGLGALVSGQLANAVNHGNAFSSPGSAMFSEQFGAGASAPGIGATAVGMTAAAASFNATALGNNATAQAVNSTALGGNANAASTASGGTAVGSAAVAAGVNSVALGQGANAQYDNSTAIGAGASTTSSNQIVLGTGQTVVVPGALSAQTLTTSNSTWNYVAGNGGGLTNVQAASAAPGGPIDMALRYLTNNSGSGPSVSGTLTTNVAVLVPGASGALTNWLCFTNGLLMAVSNVLPTGGIVGGGSSPTPDLAWWKFTEGSGTTVQDSSTSSTKHPLTLGTGATWVSGKTGSGIKGNGSTNAATSSAITFATNRVTVCLWVYAYSYPAGAQLFPISSYQTSKNPVSWEVYNSSGNLVLADYGNWNMDLGFYDQPSTGSWHHLACVFDASALPTHRTLYVDGSLKTVNQGDYVEGTLAANFADAAIGLGDRPTGSTPWDCAIDDVRIYSGALTATQVGQVYGDPQ